MRADWRIALLLAAASLWAQAPPGSAGKPEKLPALEITVSPTGFYPREVTLTSRRFFLIVHNRTGLLKTSLRLDRLPTEANGTAERVKESDQSRGSPHWAEQIQLPPGTYLLWEAQHPTWKCRITALP